MSLRWLTSLHKSSKSLFIQNVYQTEFFPGSNKLDLAQAFNNEAIKENPAINEIGKGLVDLEKRYLLGMEFPSFYRPEMEHHEEINSRVEKIIKGEMPMPNWQRGEGIDVLDQIAGIKAEIKLRHAKLDEAYHAFEEKFFATPKGKRFASFIEAAKLEDFTEFRKDFPVPPRPSQKPTNLEAQGKTGEAVAAEHHHRTTSTEDRPVTTAAEEAEGWLAKLGRHKMKAAGAAALVAAAGGWAAYEALKRKSPEGTEAKQR